MLRLGEFQYKSPSPPEPTFKKLSTHSFLLSVILTNPRKYQTEKQGNFAKNILDQMNRNTI